MENYNAIESSKEWIVSFVIKHNICPFAKKVFDEDKIGYYSEPVGSLEDLAMRFFSRLAKLKDDTAFIIYRTQFPDFLEFLDFYYACETILEDSEFDNQFQIVAFQ